MKRLQIGNKEMVLEEAVVNLLTKVKAAASLVKESGVSDFSEVKPDDYFNVKVNVLRDILRNLHDAFNLSTAVLTYVRALSADDIKHQADDVKAMVVTEVKPGDVIVFSYEGVLPIKARDNITADMQKEFPDNRVLLLEMGIKIDVYRIVTERKDEQ